MSNIFNNIIRKIKPNQSSNKLPGIDNYAFSVEELDNLSQENSKKIDYLKKNTIGIKEKEDNFTISIKKIENGSKLEEQDNKIRNSEIKDDDELSEEEQVKLEEYLSEINNEEQGDMKIEIKDAKSNGATEQNKKEIENDEYVDDLKKGKESFLNLSKQSMDIVMDNWNKINSNEIDKYIIEGKDILNHNYNITYGDNAAKFVHDIRKKYEIVICYLIGFNNEKNGIMNKTIFSDKMDNEWKYLENYIKLLEKIRNFKK